MIQSTTITREDMRNLPKEEPKEKEKKKSKFVKIKEYGVEIKGKLKKPIVKLPSYSTNKFVSNLARTNEALVREVEPREIVRDDRSLFFNSELNGEVKRDKSWLFK